MLAELTRRHPGTRVRARQENTGLLVRLLATGEIEVGLGFATRRAPGVRCEHLADEPAVVAVDSGHALAGRPAVALADLRDETFALVDAEEGRGYNDAVVEHCRRAGFEPSTTSDPHGPMAWETAVRTGGCVGLTTRSAAPSTARGTRLVELEPSVSFPLHLMLPAGSAEPAGLPARAFVGIARAATGAPDAPS